MEADLQRDDLMRRFVIGNVTDDERERVERRFLEDQSYFETLAAIETEMLVAYERGDLSPEWRPGLEARLRHSRQMMRQLDDLRAIRSALSASPQAHGHPGSRIQTPARSWRRWHMAVAASLAITALAAGALWLVSRDGSRSPAGEASDAAAPATPVVATFVLSPAGTRAGQAAADSFRVPPATDRVRLEFRSPVVEATTMHDATLRPVGGDPTPVSTVPVVTVDGSSLLVRWDLPVAVLRAGDYIVTVRGLTSDRGSVTVATRTFSIVE
jgi:hypothetical protein